MFKRWTEICEYKYIIYFFCLLETQLLFFRQIFMIFISAIPLLQSKYQES